MFLKIINSVTGSWKSILAGGFAATLVLTVAMEFIAPMFLGGPLKPALLICALFGWDQSMMWVAEILHYLTGLLAFPIGYVVVLAVTGQSASLVTGAVWGLLLFIVAGAVLAPLAGNALFFGAGRMALASLLAHLAFGVVLGLVFARMGRVQA